MDKEEAQTLLTTKLTEYRSLRHTDLVAKIGDNDCLEAIGPTGTNFRVAPGTLCEAVSGLDVLLYEESVETIPEGGQVASARLVARKDQRKTT